MTQHRDGAGSQTVLLERNRRTDRAEALLKEAIRLDPDYILSYWNLGLLLARQNRYPEATVYFERIAGITPLDPEVHACLGNLYERTGRKAEAEERFARSARLRQEARLQKRAESEIEEQLAKIREILGRLGR